MTPPLPEPVLPDADPSHAARAALEALFEKLRTQRITALERADLLHECEHPWEKLYGAIPRGRGRRKPDVSHARDLPRRKFLATAAAQIGICQTSIRRLISLRNLLSPDERTALKGTAIENSIRYLFRVAQIRDAGERAAVISALSDVGNPAPSLHEALQRAGLRRYVEAEETDRQVRRLLSAWRTASPTVMKEFRPVDVCESPEGRPQPHHVCARLSRGRGMGVMIKSLPEPLMLDGKPHYTARQIAEMRLPGMPGTVSGVHRKAARESWPLRLRPSGRGGGRVYPLEALPDEAQAKVRRPARPKPTQPAPADSGSTQKKPNDEKRLFLGLEPGQRAKVEAKAEAVVLWRHYKQRVYPSPTPARLSAHSGRPVRPERRSGRTKPCRRSPPTPYADGTRLWRGAV